MTVRPQIDDETVERVNEKLADVMRIDPKQAGMDTKINVLLEEVEELERKRHIARRSANDHATNENWSGLR